jgi:DHA1 family bicyclomycin/chloramphenicol resistance-like MFS transporter
MQGALAMAAQPRLSRALLLAFTAAYITLQPISTDLYQAALPSIGTAFGVPVASVQLTLTVFIAAFGVWQLIAGPLSDRFGRHPVALGGVLIYVAASALCTFTPSLPWLIAGRALQAVGACSCLVAARAMVRDELTPEHGARVLAVSGTILGICVVIAPILGGLLQAAFGWRATFGAMLAISTLVAAATALRLKETHRAPNRNALRAGPLVRAYAQVARAPSWHAYTWPAVCSYAGLFSFISGGSFVLIRVLGVAPVYYGLCFSFIVSGYIVGTLICRRSVPRHGMPWTMRRGALLQFVAGLVIAGLALAGAHHPLALLLPQYVFLIGHGLIQPVAQAGSMARFPHSAGVATAAMGLAMMAVAALVGQWIGASFNGTVYPLTLTIAACGVASALTTFTLVKRYGRVD